MTHVSSLKYYLFLNLYFQRKSLNTFDSARIQLDKKIQLLKEEIKGNASNNNSTPTEISKKE